MKHGIMILSLILLTACSSKSIEQSSPPETKFGLITEKEEVDLKNQDSKTRTSVFASVSSGGRVSVGIGFLVGLFNSGKKEENPVRYEVSLLDGSEITIYHSSRHFEVDDCVQITLHDDTEETPPDMERSKAGCQ
ncbi:MAG: hypothetical protein AAF353_12545 [Pseudomonadota bacterium]